MLRHECEWMKYNHLGPLSGRGRRSDQPPSLEAESHPAVWNSEGPTWHDGAGSQRGWKDNMYPHADESNDRLAQRHFGSAAWTDTRQTVCHQNACGFGDHKGQNLYYTRVTQTVWNIGTWNESWLSRKSAGHLDMFCTRHHTAISFKHQSILSTSVKVGSHDSVVPLANDSFTTMTPLVVRNVLNHFLKESLISPFCWVVSELLWVNLIFWFNLCDGVYWHTSLSENET